MRGFGRAPIVVKPEGTKDDLVALFLKNGLVVLVLVLVIVPENLNYNTLDSRERADNSAQVGDYEGVNDSLKLHGA